MAGRPKRRALVHELTKRAADECEDGTAHLEYVMRWIEEGKTLNELSRLISDDAREDISGIYITRYLTSAYPEYAVKMAEARALGAFAMVDEARDIVDALDEGEVDRNDIAVARARSDVRLWTAERFNRKDLGNQKEGVNVNITINSLHLDALRARAITANMTAAISSDEDAGLMLGAGALLGSDEVTEVESESSAIVGFKDRG